MSEGLEYVAAQARKAAQQRLTTAARYVALQAPNPLWRKRVGRRDDAILFQIERDGSLAIYEDSTGRLVALSEPGRHDQLRADFTAGDFPRG